MSETVLYYSGKRAEEESVAKGLEVKVLDYLIKALADAEDSGFFKFASVMPIHQTSSKNW